MNSTQVYYDWRSIIELCDRVNSERDRDVHATVAGLLKQLVPYLHSGTERQELQALAVCLRTTVLLFHYTIINIQ